MTNLQGSRGDAQHRTGLSAGLPAGGRLATREHVDPPFWSPGQCPDDQSPVLVVRA
jgi:hypothetical protein